QYCQRGLSLPTRRGHLAPPVLQEPCALADKSVGQASAERASLSTASALGARSWVSLPTLRRLGYGKTRYRLSERPAGLRAKDSPRFSSLTVPCAAGSDTPTASREFQRACGRPLHAGVAHSLVAATCATPGARRRVVLHPRASFACSLLTRS